MPLAQNTRVQKLIRRIHFVKRTMRVETTLEGRLIVLNDDEKPSFDEARWAIESAACPIESDFQAFYLVPRAMQHYRQQVRVTGYFVDRSEKAGPSKTIFVVNEIRPSETNASRRETEEYEKMTAPNSPARIVEAYFNAWTSKKTDEAYALLADDLQFSGPNATYHSAKEFRPGLNGFAAMTKWAKIVDLLVDGDRVAMLYDCELPAPVGVLRIASFFRVKNNKICSYDTRFDSTEFGKLVPPKR
jgi:hypothetical protein